MFPTLSTGKLRLACGEAASDNPDDMNPDLLRARLRECLDLADKKPIPIAREIGRGRDYVSDFLNGEKDSLGARELRELARVLGCNPDYFVDPFASRNGGAAMVASPIVGYAGADNEGYLIQGDSDPVNEIAPLPPGGTSKSVAVHLKGGSMRGIADDGALIYFEHQQTPPTPDMIGYPCVLELEDGRVLFKRLLRGSAPDLYDLESVAGETIRDVRLKWAAEPTAIIPPRQARRIVRRADDSQIP